MREISAQALESHKFRPSDSVNRPKTAILSIKVKNVR